MIRDSWKAVCLGFLVGEARNIVSPQQGVGKVVWNLCYIVAEIETGRTTRLTNFACPRLKYDNESRVKKLFG